MNRQGRCSVYVCMYACVCMYIYVHTYIYAYNGMLLSLKKDKLLAFIHSGMELELIMLSEVNQKENDK